MRLIMLCLSFSLLLASAAHADPFKFTQEKLNVAGKTVFVEIADTEELRERGLMFRQNLPDNHGMLFVFPDSRALSFWMKDTLIPLSIGFYDKNKKLFDTKEMTPAIMGAVMPTIYASNGEAMYALEMPKGWFAKNKVKVGSKFSFSSSIHSSKPAAPTKP